jgi:hypothetical protein
MCSPGIEMKASRRSPGRALGMGRALGIERAPFGTERA